MTMNLIRDSRYLPTDPNRREVGLVVKERVNFYPTIVISAKCESGADHQWFEKILKAIERMQIPE
jgi:hypothetical protein